MPVDSKAIREFFRCSNCSWKNTKDSENESEKSKARGHTLYFPHNSVKSETNPLPLTVQPTTTEDNLCVYKALWSFEARAEEELSFGKDDFFRVTERCGDWWKAEKLLNGQVVASGVVPSNYLVKEETLEAQPWYFGKLNRSEAQTFLLTSINPEGAFLVRHSEKDDVGYVLSVKVSDKVKHFKIRLDEKGLFFVEGNQSFADVEALVEHYQNHELSTVQITEACIRRKPVTRDLSHITVDDWELPKKEFTLEEQLGTGYFADVYCGKWKGMINVAIKILKKNGIQKLEECSNWSVRGPVEYCEPGGGFASNSSVADAMDQREFLLETQILKRLRHHHLISLFAICTESLPYYIITELMVKGNLLTFLRGPEGQNLDIMSLIEVAIQVSDGMVYLESENSIHRDLAARNVLVGEDNICKVADFGLARVIKEPIYVSDDKKIPYKWSAPEAISHGRYSSKSDVWSFGILLYEIFTYGGLPYPTYANHEVFLRITEGYRMPCPPKCPTNIYDIMLMCWDFSPDDRPDFKELRSILQDCRRYDEWAPDTCNDDLEPPEGSEV